MAETVIVCDEAVTRALPSATEQPSFWGTFAEGAPSAVRGAVDACRLGREHVNSVARLAEIAAEGRLAAVDGAFQLAVHERERLTLARDAIGHRTLFYAPKSPSGFAYASDIKTLLARSGASKALDARAVAA